LPPEEKGADINVKPLDKSQLTTITINIQFKFTAHGKDGSTDPKSAEKTYVKKGGE
jgi:hypothetical protein